MDITNNATISKLVLLYVFDKMEMPLTENTIIEMCCSTNEWLGYMMCKEIMAELLDTSFLIVENVPNGEPLYSITADGRSCLSYFFVKIPTSLREEIAEYVKNNKLTFRRKQEFFRDYFKNKDGTYTVLMRILDRTGANFELKMNVENRLTAKSIYKNWESKASNVYGAVFDILVDDN